MNKDHPQNTQKRHHFIKLVFATLLILVASVTAYAEDVAHAEDVVQSIPKNVDEMWAGFEKLDKSTSLEVEILSEWEQDEVVCRIIRYQAGVFKGSPTRVAAFYAFPKGGTNLPALVQMGET